MCRDPINVHDPIEESGIEDIPGINALTADVQKGKCMDPDTVLDELIRAICDNAFSTAESCFNSLRDWHRKGGFFA